MRIIDNFVSEEDCDYLVNFHEKNFNLNNESCKNYKEMLIMRCNLILDDPIIKKINISLSKITKYSDKLYSEIVKRPEKHSQGYHIDSHPYASIIYLNTNYEGGQTVVDEETIMPSKGKLISFEGSKVFHKVNEITKGNRYTISTWFGSEIPSIKIY